MAHTLADLRSVPNTTLGKLFYASFTDLQEGPMQILKETKKLVKKQGHKKDDFKKLENFLNSFFGNQSYGKKNSNITDEMRVIFQEAVQGYIASMVQDRVSKLDLNDDNKTKASGQDDHQFYITCGVFQRRCEYVLETLRNLNDEQKQRVFGVQDVKELEDYVNGLLNWINGEIGNQLNNNAGIARRLMFATRKRSTGEMKDRDSELKQKVNTLDKYYAAAKTANKSVQQAYGKGFEQALAVLKEMIGDSTQEISQGLLEEALNKIGTLETEGSNQAWRGEVNSGILKLGEVTTKRVSSLKEGKKDSFIKQVTASTDKSTYQIDISPFDGKQGKVDITFKIPEVKEGFNISAKNWQSLLDRDFGETTLYNALMRTVNLDKTLEYGLVLGYYGPRDKIWPELKVHQFAKVAVLVDTLIGYSQINNYADTLVINDRSNKSKPIKVYSMYDILDKLDRDLDLIDSLPVLNYSEAITGFDLKQKGENIASAYISKIQSALKRTKVAISSSMLNNFK